MSVSRGCRGCLRAKASSWAVSSAPRSAASAISLAIEANGGLSATASASRSIVPVMTVSMLLKSCEMPPTSCPTASIFSDCRLRSSAASVWVRSRMKPLNNVPPCRRNAVTLNSTFISLPSRRSASICRRFPSSALSPVRRKRASPSRWRERWAGGTISSPRFRPIASSRDQPKTVCACAFQSTTVPLSSIWMKASSAVSMMPRAMRSLSRSAAVLSRASPAMRAKACANSPISPPASVGIAAGWSRANPSTARVICTSGRLSERASSTAKAIAPSTAVRPANRLASRIACAAAISPAYGMASITATRGPSSRAAAQAMPNSAPVRSRRTRGAVSA